MLHNNNHIRNERIDTMGIPTRPVTKKKLKTPEARSRRSDADNMTLATERPSPNFLRMKINLFDCMHGST